MHRTIPLIICLLLLPALATAQRDRSGDWDVGFQLADYASLSLSGFGGASMHVDSSFGYGMSGAYNFTNRLALGVDASWRSPDYRARFVPDGPGPPQVIDATMDVARIHFKGIFYFLESDLTPFVEVGYGWTEIDSNIVDGPPITGCWWDPWWGFVCRNYYSTYTETRSTWGASVGLRWDMRGPISLRGSIGSLKIDRARGVNNSNVNTGQFEVLWRF